MANQTLKERGGKKCGFMLKASSFIWPFFSQKVYVVLSRRHFYISRLWLCLRSKDDQWSVDISFEDFVSTTLSGLGKNRQVMKVHGDVPTVCFWIKQHNFPE